MKIIVITQIQHTLSYLCMVYTQEDVATWEFLPEVSLAYPFRTITDAKYAISERFAPISDKLPSVQFVPVFPEAVSLPDSPLLKHLKTPVEDLIRKTADYQSSWYFGFDGQPLFDVKERPLGAMRGQISQEMLDAVDPTKKDPTE